MTEGIASLNSANGKIQQDVMRLMKRVALLIVGVPGGAQANPVQKLAIDR